MSDKNLTSKRPTSQAIRFPIPTTRSDLIKQIGRQRRRLTSRPEGVCMPEPALFDLRPMVGLHAVSLLFQHTAPASHVEWQKFSRAAFAYACQHVPDLRRDLGVTILTEGGFRLGTVFEDGTEAY